MVLTRYSPTADLFTPLFEDFLAPFRRMGGLVRMPEADVVETENHIQVLLELPGMKPEDIELSLENNVLTVSGEKQEERNEGDETRTYHLSERRWGRFSRSFVLPREVDPDKIEARFENGVLTITVPKTEKARRRRIEIRAR